MHTLNEAQVEVFRFSEGVGAAGDWPCFAMDLDEFVAAMQRKRHLVLHDTLLLDEVCEAQRADRNGRGYTENGIRIWYAMRAEQSVHDIIRYYAHDLAKSAVVCLTPNGHPLQHSNHASLVVRSSPDDIFFSEDR